MSAKADAEAAAALRELGATLKASTNAPKLHTRNETYFAGSTNMSIGSLTATRGQLQAAALVEDKVEALVEVKRNRWQRHPFPRLWTREAKQGPVATGKLASGGPKALVQSQNEAEATPGGQPGHTQDTRTHKGTRTAQTNLTTIPTQTPGGAGTHTGTWMHTTGEGRHRGGAGSITPPAGTHRTHTGHAGAQGHTDHTDEPRDPYIGKFATRTAPTRQL